MPGLLLAVGTVQRPDLFVQSGVLCIEAVDLLLLGNGLAVELLRGDVARLRTVYAALQPVLGHRRGIGVLILLEADARHDVVGAEAGPRGGFRAVVSFVRGGKGGAGLVALARDNGFHDSVDMRSRFVTVHDGRDNILRPEGLGQPGEVVVTPLR